jgi:hypothetical protein
MTEGSHGPRDRGLVLVPPAIATTTTRIEDSPNGTAVAELPARSFEIEERKAR